MMMSMIMMKNEKKFLDVIINIKIKVGKGERKSAINFFVSSNIYRNC